MSRKPRRSARDLFATTTLALEAFVALFAALVAYGLNLADPLAITVSGLVVAVLSFVAAGLLRRGEAGYVLGWAVQVLLLLTGLVVPMMFVVGGIFAVLWAVSLRVGSQLDAERVEREDAEEAYLAQQGR